ncbi:MULTISPECIES: hypothetical protein [unclassified Mesotoga]|jgi:hypothetical protein|uniref:Uncharacterized protein n=1 Tax=Mesotoga prima TaxID=1184387 RepID=A0A101HMQ7_9BACT|nr:MULTISPECIES: hypothetical protein [unclassified Mesotoga]KUK79683.1 MAG: Uncharacterized protein XD94_1323 [Mesotoga prima]PNQ05486.1 hypothetical protein RM69_04680 [Mesotoga sp. SC_NapDC3]PXF34562.1 hypothetical protein EU77_06915 [Mesotoga sp. SC_NapDC]PNS40424.1 hypothetical protein RJ60_06670 [Mesotoga sp. B105.6.4]PVD16508.1 exodeoxyribonuclease VII [Mesotoga sp. Brook.08.105.5.1]
MDEKTLESVLKLKEEQINSMDFKKLLGYIRSIDEYFRSNSQIDVEVALKAYQKAIQLLTAARLRLITLKREKEELDRQYSSFLASIETESSEEMQLPTDGDDEDEKLPF